MNAKPDRVERMMRRVIAGLIAALVVYLGATAAYVWVNAMMEGWVR